MDSAEYERLALRTEADQAAILERLVKLGPQAMRLDNAVRGLCSDAGEVANAAMRYIEYGRDLDVTNVVEECGDCLWRIVQALAAVGRTLDDAMRSNHNKLKVRYPGMYSDKLSAQRNTDMERKALESTKGDDV